MFAEVVSSSDEEAHVDHQNSKKRHTHDDTDPDTDDDTRTLRRRKRPCVSMTVDGLHDIIAKLGVKVDLLESRLESLENKFETDSVKTMTPPRDQDSVNTMTPPRKKDLVDERTDESDVNFVNSKSDDTQDSEEEKHVDESTTANGQ